MIFQKGQIGEAKHIEYVQQGVVYSGVITRLSLKASWFDSNLAYSSFESQQTLNGIDRKSLQWAATLPVRLRDCGV